jgi:hypothetical protein
MNSAGQAGHGGKPIDRTAEPLRNLSTVPDAVQA